MTSSSLTEHTAHTKATTQTRRLLGVVVSTKMQKTAVVRVDRRVSHPKYGKYYMVSKTYKVHDPQSVVHVGDVVLFEACRPLSHDKRWRYVSTQTSGDRPNVVTTQI